ncbi:IS5 family transposase [Streptomyces klenkii]|uniref:IS5 family transposase n=1 Tax=Streptomyces klenkii TaxID=1420899 RepID=UPI0036EAE1C9
MPGHLKSSPIDTSCPLEPSGSGRSHTPRSLAVGRRAPIRSDSVPDRGRPNSYGSSASRRSERMLSAVQADADAEGRLDWSQAGVDSTSCRAHQHAAGARKAAPVSGPKGVPIHHRADEGLGRSRGGLTSKIHLACEGRLRPLALLVTPGQSHDGTVFEAVVEQIRVHRRGGGRPRTRPDVISADKAYSPRRIRSYLRRRQIPHAIPEKKDQARHRVARGSAGGRPPSFDRAAYKRRNEVERTINKLKGFRAVATRYDKRAYVFHGTVTVAAIRLWLRA